jgi:ribonuclease P protein subunit RPR2
MSLPAERIDRLDALARQAAIDREQELARVYVRRAYRVAERHRLSVPKRLDRFSCDGCDSYQRPGQNVRVRTRCGHVVMTCDCGAQSRYRYS